MITVTYPAAKDIGITGRQESLVYLALELGGECTFDDIRRFLKDKGGMLARETAISARIRDINRKLRINNMPFIIKHKPKKKGSHDQVYWLAEI